VTVGVLDRLQRKYPAAGYPLAVVYKFFEDFGEDPSQPTG
jgi:hypothetical protein